MEIYVQKLQEDATLPLREERHAGIDVCAAMSYNIRPGERIRVRTGIALALPEGCIGLVKDKSELAHKIGLTVLGGVIESTDREEVLIDLTNIGSVPYVIERGSAVAQIIVQAVSLPDIVEVKDTTNQSSHAKNSV